MKKITLTAKEYDDLCLRKWQEGFDSAKKPFTKEELELLKRKLKPEIAYNPNAFKEAIDRLPEDIKLSESILKKLQAIKDV